MSSMRIVAGQRRTGKTERLAELIREELQDPEARPVLVVTAHARAWDTVSRLGPQGTRVHVCTVEELHLVRGMGPKARVFVDDADYLIRRFVDATFAGLPVAALTISPDEVTSWTL